MTGGLIMLTRPAVDAEDYGRELTAAGFGSLIVPMLIITPQNVEIPNLQKYQGLIFTSGNAAREFVRHSADKNMPVFTVGLQTEKVARDLGFNDVRSASGDAWVLASFIIKAVSPGGLPFLHVRGVDVSQSLRDILRSSAIQIEELVMYKAEKAKNLSAEAVQALRENKISAVTFFSKRTAENFMTLARENGLESALKHTKALCLSDEVLECVQPAAWASAHAAETPDRQAMTALIRRFCA